VGDTNHIGLGSNSAVTSVAIVRPHAVFRCFNLSSFDASLMMRASTRTCNRTVAGSRAHWRRPLDARSVWTWRCGALTARASGRRRPPRARGKTDAPAPPHRRAEAANHALGRRRGGLGSELHLVSNGEGVPLAVAVNPSLPRPVIQAADEDIAV
jgi:hypothetical protein